MPVTVRLARRTGVLCGALAFGALLLWTAQHVVSLPEILRGDASVFAGVYFLAVIFLLGNTVLCYAERPYRTTPRKQRLLDEARLVVNVPVYNEDAAALANCLESMFAQSRKPDCVFVVDDGSTVDYGLVKAWFLRTAAQHGVEARWERQPNAGKRHAQGRTIAGTPDADFYLTVDSDAVLTEDAVREGLKPFADARVQSVAGVVLVQNRVNLLTWFTDLWFVVGQLVDRSAMSSVGGVLVNSGALAFYRGGLLRDNLDGYLNEEFFGRKVELSDDSLLTIYALANGRAVQQPTSFALTLMPEKFSHHRRQYLRWMRGAFIRSWWRFRYLPLSSTAYWMHFFGWVQMVTSTLTFAVFFVYTPIVEPSTLPYLLVIPVIVSYGQGLRYLMVRRSDTTLRRQLLVYLFSPVLAMYSFFVLRVMRWYAMATCLNLGWGTRAQVESLTAGASTVTLEAVAS